MRTNKTTRTGTMIIVRTNGMMNMIIVRTNVLIHSEDKCDDVHERTNVLISSS